ncbi:unnamed protein product, partial [Polarella glacialis]
ATVADQGLAAFLADRAIGTTPPSSQKEPWSIPRGEIASLGGAAANLDGEGSPRKATGRSPSRCAMWRGSTIVVAKEVTGKLLIERSGSSEELQRRLAELTAAECPNLAKLYGACLDVEPAILVM